MGTCSQGVAVIFPDDQIVLKVSIFLVMTIHCLYHIAILSDSDSRVNVEPSQNNYRFLDGFMSSKSCNLKIMSQTLTRYCRNNC